ncbi:MAG: dicarboxylate/amino acid:cation symporter, partial [Burkholderiales bacterium]
TINSLSSHLSLKTFLDQIIPASVAESFATNNIIQIVVFSIFFGIAGVAIGEPVAPVFDFFDLVSKLMFRVTDYVMQFAPIAVFSAVGAMIVGSGLGVLSSYFLYMAEFLLGVIIIWGIMIAVGFTVIGNKIFALLRLLADSLGIAFSTASSEAVLPRVLEELEKFGISPRISGFILPLGYSFNLIGSMLNCIFATMFIIQLHGYNLTLGQEVTMLLMLMITSKGIAGIPRASLVIVAATLSSMGIPESAILILFPVDGFLDMARTTTNVFANALAAVFVDKWEKNR